MYSYKKVFISWYNQNYIKTLAKLIVKIFIVEHTVFYDYEII
jgi:hypothetical protein